MTRNDKLKTWALVAIAVSLVLITGGAHAQASAQPGENLAVICTQAQYSGQRVETSCQGAGEQRYDRPRANDLVRVDPARAIGDLAQWTGSNTAYVWKPFKALTAGELYEVCRTRIAPQPTGPACQDWAFVPKWYASGGTGTATLTWTPPTQNVDGSALANLTGYRVYAGKDVRALLKVADVPATATTYTVTGMPSGEVMYFTVTAVAGSDESAPSGMQAKYISTGQAAASTVGAK
jgi:hypothetical protein